MLKAVSANRHGLTCTGDGLNVFKQYVGGTAAKLLPQPGPSCTHVRDNTTLTQ